MGRDPQIRVPALTTRRRIERLRSAGWTLRQIADAAEVSVSTVHRALGSKHVSRLTANALRSIEP